LVEVTATKTLIVLWVEKAFSRIQLCKCHGGHGH